VARVGMVRSIRMKKASMLDDSLHQSFEVDKPNKRKVRFLFPVVTDIQIFCTVPDDEKHRCFYCGQEILHFKREFQREMQHSCTKTWGETLSVLYRRCQGEDAPVARRLCSPDSCLDKRVHLKDIRKEYLDFQSAYIHCSKRHGFQAGDSV